MPWKECSVMDERLRFVGRLLDGEAMTAVCREFGISRKTGYKIFDRYKEHGLEALTDRSRRRSACRMASNTGLPSSETLSILYTGYNKK
jgi:transposase